MAKSLPDVVRDELREVIEFALEEKGSDGRDLVETIDHANRPLYMNGFPRRARTITEWVNPLVVADATLQANWFAGGQPLHETGMYISGRLGANPRNVANLTILWTELLREVARQQKDDLIKIFKLVYERTYAFHDKGWLIRNYKNLCNAISPHFGNRVKHTRVGKKDVMQDGVLFNEMHKYFEQVWAGVRGQNVPHTLEYLNHVVALLLQQYFEYGTEGLGLIFEGVNDAFKSLGFTVGGAPLITITAYGGARAYLEHNAGTSIGSSISARAPNAQRGTEYFYAWWLFNSEEDFQKIHKSMRWPRNRQEDRNNYREPGRKEATLAELLGASKGTGDVEGYFLGARDMCNREVPFTDEVRKPAFHPGQVIALGAAPAKLFDLATKEIRIGDWFHSVKRQPGMTVPQLIKEYVREGKMRFDATNLIWHWTKWDGELPIKYGRVTGRVVDEALMRTVPPPPAIPAAGHLTAPDQAQKVYNDVTVPSLQLNHSITVELLDAAGAVVSTHIFPTDAQGRFDITDWIPLDVPFRIKSPKTIGYKEGKHADGWPGTPILQLTGAAPTFEHVIVPKHEAKGGGVGGPLKLVTVIPSNSPMTSHIERENATKTPPKHPWDAGDFGRHNQSFLLKNFAYVSNVDGALSFSLLFRPTAFTGTPGIVCFLAYEGPDATVALAPAPTPAPFMPKLFDIANTFTGPRVLRYIPGGGAAPVIANLVAIPPLLGVMPVLHASFVAVPGAADQRIIISLHIGPNPTPDHPPLAGPTAGFYRLYCVVKHDSTPITAAQMADVVQQRDAVGTWAYDYNYITFTIINP